MTLKRSGFQSDSDLDSIRNSCDVYDKVQRTICLYLCLVNATSFRIMGIGKWEVSFCQWITQDKKIYLNSAYIWSKEEGRPGEYTCLPSIPLPTIRVDTRQCILDNAPIFFPLFSLRFLCVYTFIQFKPSYILYFSLKLSAFLRKKQEIFRRCVRLKQIGPC